MKKVYVGTKIVVAYPQKKDDKDGYAVVYEDNYTSWSPKEVFENSYREVREQEKDMINKQLYSLE